MRRVKDAADAALGVAILIALLLVALDAPVWLALIAIPAAAATTARILLSPDNDNHGDDPR